LALNDDGAIIASGRGGLIYFNERTGEERSLLSAFEGHRIDTANDIQPDGKGGLYVGLVDGTAMHTGRPIKGCPLLHLDRQGKASRLWDGIVMSNGMGLNADGSRLYHCESAVGVWVYDVAADGTLATRRLLVHLVDCDGMAVDIDEGIWVARYSSGEVVRFRRDGTAERTVPVPVKHVFSVTFGGGDLRDLYIVTGSDYWDRSARTGSIFRMRSDVPGLKTPRTAFR
jgi:sugar lactone lactonase YvrE